MQTQSGAFDFNVELLRRDKEILSPWYPLEHAHWRIRAIYSSRLNSISVAVISTVSVQVDGTFSMNGRTHAVTLVQDDVTQLPAWGVISISQMDQLYSPTASVQYHLMFNRLPPQANQQLSMNWLMAPPQPPPQLPSPVQRDVDYDVEQFFSLRSTWHINIADIKSHKLVTSPKMPLIINPNVHWWLTFAPCGSAIRTGLEKKWVMTLNADHPDIDMEGYFYPTGHEKPYYDFENMVHESSCLSSMSNSDFVITKRILSDNGTKAKKGHLSLSFRIKVKPSNSVSSCPSVVKSEPTEFNQSSRNFEAAVEDAPFQLGRLLQSEEGAQFADAVLYARSARVMPVHSFVLGFHSSELYGLYKRELEREIQSFDGHQIVVNLDYSAAALRKVVEFFYGGKFEEAPSAEVALELVNFISEYKAHHFEDYFLQYLELGINKNTVCLLLKAANRVGNKQLEDICIEFMSGCHEELATLYMVEEVPLTLLPQIFRKVKNMGPCEPEQISVDPPSLNSSESHVKQEPVDLVDEVMIEETFVVSNNEEADMLLASDDEL